MSKNLLVKKRHYFFSLMLLFLSFSSISAQMEKGIFRIGLAADFTTRGDIQTGVDFRLGDLLTDNLELDLEMAVRYYGLFMGASGIFKGGLIYHFKPDSKYVPGIGFTVGMPFGTGSGSKNPRTNISAFFNLDNFVNRNWAFTFKAGIERESIGRAYYPKAEYWFIARFGISTFWRQR